MNEHHVLNDKTKGINLPPFEAHFASLCVAVTTGSIGGNIGSIFVDIIPHWSLLILVCFFGVYYSVACLQISFQNGACLVWKSFYEP